MLPQTSALLIFSLLVAAPLGAQEPSPKPKASTVADVASNKGDSRFNQMHQAFLKRGKDGPIGVLFLGDSITHYWSKEAPDLWKSAFGKYEPANFGIAGDRTQHVLWRIENGELDGIEPKVVVLMIGTNNLKDNNAPEVLSGIKAIVTSIQAKLPNTKILLLGIFPRGPRMPAEGTAGREAKVAASVAKKSAAMDKIQVINAELARMENGTTIRYLDLGPKFLNAEGKIPDNVMPDQLHPGPDGYKIWAEGMQPLLDEMMSHEKTP